MKTLITLTFASALFYANNASSQDLRPKFENQINWTNVTVGSTGDWDYKAFETDRNSIRLSANDYYSVIGNLKVPATGKDLATWEKSCGARFDSVRLQGFGNPVLNLVANPFSKDNLIKWNGKDGQNHTGTWADVENFPKFLNPKIVVNQNNFSLSSYLWPGPYQNYVDKVEKALNEQLFQQREEFLITGELNLDLGGDVLKFFACDLGLKLASLSVILEYKMEPAKAPMTYWIGGNGNYDEVIKNVSERIKNTGKVTKLQAGIMLGMALQEERAGTEVFTLDRDEKLFKSMFTPSRENSELYEMKLFSSIVEVNKAFYTLAELDLAFMKDMNRETEVEMSGITATVGR
ncbi:MAG: hypothetical protein V4598_08000 [Bdellovibrionota bacterium]